MCCVGLGSSEPQSHFGFPHMPSQQAHLSHSLVISGACEKATQREDVRGKCGSVAFNLTLKFKKKRRKCALTPSHFQPAITATLSLKADGIKICRFCLITLQSSSFSVHHDTFQHTRETINTAVLIGLEKRGPAKSRQDQC